jgi:retinol-binding protein 3
MNKILYLVLPLALLAQPQPELPDRTVDAAARNQVLDGLAEQLKRGYVFPEVAGKMIADLDSRRGAKQYESITSARQFATTLTEHLQAISKDKHLRVRYSYDALPVPRNEQPSPEQVAEFRANMARGNFGFAKLEILPGNVGYLDLRGFAPPSFAGETAVAAMTYLANADALIVDLRNNGGGSPAMVALLTTFLYGENDEQHLNDLYFRPEDSTRQWWTLPYIPAKRFAGKPVYVLTANRTFSAAEEFTYNLKNLKRATIVGETTGGGAHPGGTRRLHDHFDVFVPSGRAINPVSKTNWEGTGVKPDIDVPKEKALATAHIAAIEKVMETTTDERRKDALRRAMDQVRKQFDAAPGAAKN